MGPCQCAVLSLGAIGIFNLKALEADAEGAVDLKVEEPGLRRPRISMQKFFLHYS